jgi:histidinol-phosphatase
MPSTSATAAPPVEPELIDFAVGLAQRAGRLSRELFYATHQSASLKADGTEVTEADLWVEDLLRSELSRYRPEDGIYGEESGSTAGTSGRQWVLDPIDGTYYFARRIAGYTNVITYVDDHGPCLAVINDPISFTTLYAGRGQGCWLQLRDPVDPHRIATRPARVSTTARLGSARTQMINPVLWSEELMVALHRTVFLHPSSGVIELATGRTDAAIVTGTLQGYEDLAPLPVIVGEAGGRVTDLAGRPVLSGNGDALITNGLLHDGFLELVDGLTTARALPRPKPAD